MTRRQRRAFIRDARQRARRRPRPATMDHGQPETITPSPEKTP